MIKNSDPAMLISRVRFILLNHEKLPVSQFVKVYMQYYQHKVDIDTDFNKIPEVMWFSTFICK